MLTAYFPLVLSARRSVHSAVRPAVRLSYPKTPLRCPPGRQLCGSSNPLNRSSRAPRLIGVCNGNRHWEGAGESGILVFVTQPDTGGPPCAFPEKPIRFSKLLKRIYLTSPSHNWPVWSCCGAILAGSACQNAVASALSPWRSWNNLRQYLREWLYDGSDRARPCKTQLDVTLCFAPLLRSPGGCPAGWQWPSIRLSRATRPPPSSSASSTGAAPFPWPGASTAPFRKAPGWTPPWNCSGNWPQPFPGK